MKTGPAVLITMSVKGVYVTLLLKPRAKTPPGHSSVPAVQAMLVMGSHATTSMNALPNLVTQGKSTIYIFLCSLRSLIFTLSCKFFMSDAYPLLQTRSATCLNSGGSYSCLCNVGYSGTGLVCEDVNECGTDQPCAAPGVCANCPGSFHCVCPVGYLFDTLGVCQDINECIHPTVCMGNSTCSNVNGSFSCACLPGYINQGSECVPDPDAPIDPRTNPCTPDPCHVHASCSANSTGYTCKCDAGYIGNGTVCTNEDECKKENTCANSVCVDTKGSYVCQCYDFSFVQPCPSGISPSHYVK